MNRSGWQDLLHLVEKNIIGRLRKFLEISITFIYIAKTMKKKPLKKSSLRRQGSHDIHWIPAFAGMTRRKWHFSRDFKKQFLIFLILISSLIGMGAKYGDNYYLSSANITPKVLRHIQQNYIDQNRIKPAAMLKGALEQIQKSAAEVLVTFDADGRFTITIDKSVKKFNPGHISTLDDLWETLKDIYLFIALNYHGSIESKDLEYLAIEGMLNVLDPHSSILTPKIYNEFKIGTKGKFGGIGIVIGSKEGELTVIAPIEGTPAWRAGIKAGDKIMQIGEESTINMSLTEAVELLRGDVGTDVAISIGRKGKAQPFNVALKRAVINIDSLQSAIMPVGNKSVGYIKIKSFQENTDKEFSKELEKLKQAPNFSGLILDLRNNPGGLLNQAIEIADKFLSSGIIVSTRGAGERFIEQEPAKEEGTEPLYPLIVLVNEGSASASEIVSGTLQSYKRAIVIGIQTFGKGSVQTVFDLKDGSALKLTIAEYLTAGKNSIQSIGVTPDIKLVPVVVEKEKMDLIEDEHESEMNLEGHLIHDESIKKSESAHKLSFLEKAEEENDDEKSRREYSNKIDFSKDFAALLAGRLIAGVQNLSDNPFAGIASAVLEENKKQQASIAAYLSRLNINWSECKPRGKPLLQVSFFINKGGVAIEKVKAGDEISLSLSVKNIGTGDFCKLVGISDAKESIFKNKEFVFGKIEPAESKKWEIPLKIPKNMDSQNLPIAIKFHEAGSNQPSPFMVIIPVEGLFEPQFIYSFNIGSPLNVKVPKTAIPVGKTIPFTIDIKNTGKGAASNATAIIKPLDSKGIFIDTGRANLGMIQPGESKSAAFKFHIEPSLSKSTFELELTIMDQDLLTALSEKIEFNVGSSTTIPAANQWYEGPHITLNQESFPIAVSAQKYHIQATISDDQRVKDYFIYVGGDKVIYASNPENSSTYKLDTELPLKDGNNLISIFARDNQDMMTRYSFVVEKK